MSIMRGSAVFAQAVAVIALIAGLWLILPLGWFLVAGGLTVLALSISVEILADRRASERKEMTDGAR